MRCQTEWTDSLELSGPAAFSRTPLLLLLPQHDLGNANVIKLGDVLYHG